MIAPYPDATLHRVVRVDAHLQLELVLLQQADEGGEIDGDVQAGQVGQVDDDGLAVEEVGRGAEALVQRLGQASD